MTGVGGTLGRRRGRGWSAGPDFGHAIRSGTGLEPGNCIEAVAEASQSLKIEAGSI